MIRPLLLLLTLTLASATLSLKQANGTIHELWDAAMKGDGPRYHNLLASNVVVLLNGETDDAPWQQENFIKGLFSKIRYLDMKMLTPLALEASTGTFVCHHSWNIVVLSTGQDIEMGAWSARFNFDESGKISKIANIGLASPLKRLATALSNKKDYRDVLENFVKALSANDASSAKRLLDKDFIYASNGEDIEDWDRNLPNLLSKAKFNVKILDFGSSGPGDALATIESVATAGGKSVTSLQGWQISFNTTAPETISQIVVIQDSLSAFETDQLMKGKL